MYTRYEEGRPLSKSKQVDRSMGTIALNIVSILTWITFIIYGLLNC